MNTRQWLVSALIAGALIVAAKSGPSFAGSNSSNLNVSAAVQANCTISTSALGFGNYDPISVNDSGGSDLDGTGIVTITCTKGSGLDITLGLGNNAVGSQRKLIGTASGDLLNYEIYQNAGRTTVWSTGADKQTITAAPSKAARAFTAYGRIVKGQDISADSYSDIVVAIVNF
ncbi:MAG: spore coat U domain-containing protein [Armatimonadota bacterium]|nr:spore coat U domain-containing protein [Armatimonadota bacterium]